MAVPSAETHTLTNMNNLKLEIDEHALRKLAGQSPRDAYGQALAGKRCPTHGRPVRVSQPDASGAVHLSGCCDVFVKQASRALA
jgi:hypothetical protein